MKKISLSPKRKSLAGKYFAMVDDEDYDYLNQWSWSVIRGATTNYASRLSYDNNVKKYVRIHMHRVLLGIIDTKIWGDHKDHNGLNNQKYNLRPSTISQNSSNLTSHKNSTSKYLGVCWLKTRQLWLAAITDKKGKVKRLGTFEQEIEAAEVYNEAALIAHGEFANLNIIDTNFERLGKKNPPKSTKYDYIYMGGRKMDKYKVVISNKGKRYYVGYFNTELEAALAYNKKAIELFGDNAKVIEL